MVETLEKPKPAIDTDELLKMVNKRLLLDQQIRKDDPLYAVVVLMEELVQAYAEPINQKNAQLLEQISACSEQQAKLVEAAASRGIDNSTETAITKINNAVAQGESRLQQAFNDTKSSTPWYTRAAWIVAAGVVVMLCAIFGVWIANILFGVLYHAK